MNSPNYRQQQENEERRQQEGDMQGLIEKVQLAKTGKSYRVQIGGAWFGAKKNTGVEQMQGKTISYRVDSDPKFGDWLEDIEVVQTRSAPQGPTAPPVGNGDRFYMPFVSNVVAHAIQAGRIENPEELSKWAKAAYDAAQALDTL